MSYILALDTSVDACSVALAMPECIDQITEVAPREHTQKLLPAVAKILAKYQLELSQCEAIAFGVGPGSFTGLRIALSTAQGLAYGADLPLIPVSTLHAMAQTAFREGLAKQDQVIIPAIDARMTEVYFCAYRYQPETESVEPIIAEQLSSPADLAKHPLLHEQPVLVGSGWQYDELDELLSVRSLSPCLHVYPQAYDVAFLAQKLLAKLGQSAMIDPMNALPTYIRDEVSWKKRQRIRQS